MWPCSKTLCHKLSDAYYIGSFKQLSKQKPTSITAGQCSITTSTAIVISVADESFKGRHTLKNGNFHFFKIMFCFCFFTILVALTPPLQHIKSRPRNNREIFKSSVKALVAAMRGIGPTHFQARNASNRGDACHWAFVSWQAYALSFKA